MLDDEGFGLDLVIVGGVGGGEVTADVGGGGAGVADGGINAVSGVAGRSVNAGPGQIQKFGNTAADTGGGSGRNINSAAGGQSVSRYS